MAGNAPIDPHLMGALMTMVRGHVKAAIRCAARDGPEAALAQFDADAATILARSTPRVRPRPAVLQEPQPRRGGGRSSAKRDAGFEAFMATITKV